MMLDLTKESARALRYALLGNAAFSSLCALLILFAHESVLGWLGLQAVSLKSLGYLLLLFAALLIWMSRSKQLPSHLVSGVVASDWAWVFGSVVLLLLKYSAFSTFGLFLVLDVAAVIMVLAILQRQGLKQLAASSA